MASTLAKPQLFAALTAHLKAKLAAQRQQAQALVTQASESNQEFFLKLQQTCGQDTERQGKALEAYESQLQACHSVAPGALVHVSLKHMLLQVPTAATPQQTYQALSKQTLAKQFKPLSPQRAYWWLLPRVAASADKSAIEFDWQGYCIQVVSGEIVGYEKNTILGLQAGATLYGVDYAGYYDERGNSTYPNIDLYQLHILDIT